MGLLILGDVHGCFYTLRAMVREHWKPEEDTLILIGDLINKGPHSARAFKYWIKLNEAHPSKVILIRGNHEQWFLDNYRHQSRNKTFLKLCEEFESRALSPKLVAREISLLPLHFENEEVFVSHAGISDAALDPFDISDMHGVLKNRKNLKRLAKIQVIGHNIIDQGKPMFRPSENAWYIDTGAWCKEFLSGLHFNFANSSPRIVQMPRKTKDEPKSV